MPLDDAGVLWCARLRCKGVCWVSLAVVGDSRAALQGGSLLCSDSYFVSVHARHSQRWHGVGFGLVVGLVVKREKYVI